MTINFISIGRRITILRKRRRLSQMELAEIINRSLSFISYIENGQKIMSIDTLVAIANALDASADEILADNLKNTVNITNHQFAHILSDCSEYERQVLSDIITAAKRAMRTNRYRLGIR